jgi:hypothetical protein
MTFLDSAEAFTPPSGGLLGFVGQGGESKPIVRPAPFLRPAFPGALRSRDQGWSPASACTAPTSLTACHRAAEQRVDLVAASMALGLTGRDDIQQHQRGTHDQPNGIRDYARPGRADQVQRRTPSSYRRPVFDSDRHNNVVAPGPLRYGSVFQGIPAGLSGASVCPRLPNTPIAPRRARGDQRCYLPARRGPRGF